MKLDPKLDPRLTFCKRFMIQKVLFSRCFFYRGDRCWSPQLRAIQPLVGGFVGGLLRLPARVSRQRPAAMRQCRCVPGCVLDGLVDELRLLTSRRDIDRELKAGGRRD
jgi:hypothetical protein